MLLIIVFRHGKISKMKMNEIGQKDGQIPVQIIRSEMPGSIMVFGILGVIVGALGLFCPTTGIFRWAAITPNRHHYISFEQTVWVFFLFLIGIVFSIWLLVVSIGLIGYKRWARKGAVVYGIAYISWFVIAWCINGLMMLLGWIEMQKIEWPVFIFGIVLGLLGMIYPVLLLIFMKSKKIKEAFAVIGG